MVIYPAGKKIIEKLFELNSFTGIYDLPLIAVIRNSILKNGVLEYCADTMDNCCDTVMLIDGKGCIALTGRTFPHKEYQTKQVEGTANACYIASGWYPKAWIKGKHLGKYPALVEAIPFLYWRSSDMILGNDDDFNEYDSVGDNFHGFAPYSAGCVTVRGYMAPPQSTDDWKVAYDWIYSIHKNNQSFSAVLFNFRDVENLNIQKLRFGSTGSQVEHMQTLLKKYIPEMDVDGSFGPATHAALRTFQAKCGIPDTGIYGILTMAALEVSAS